MLRETKLQRLSTTAGELQLTYTGSSSIQEGVDCDTYSIDGDTSRDLGVIFIEPGFSSPRQRVIEGDETIEGYVEGEGTLVIQGPDGLEMHDFTPQRQKYEVAVRIGEIMQWHAGESGLVFFEVCQPPFQQGRFENLPDRHD